MVDSWIKSTIGYLCDQGEALIQTGPFGSQLHAHDYEPIGIPVIPTEAIGRRRLRIEGLPKVSKATVERLSRHKLKEGDILFARRGVQATGLSAIVDKKHEGWLCGTGAILLRVNSANVDAKFLSFALTSESSTSWLKAHAVGAVMPNLNEGIIRRFPLLLPPIKEQQIIARILSTLDDKIELNRRMNETLEAMARSLFKSWFVDFDPVRAQVEGKQLFFMNDTGALFPSTFQESEIGKIPKSWRVALIRDEAKNIQYGLTQSACDEPIGPRFLRITDIQGGLVDWRTVPFCRASEKEYERYRLEAGDILVARTGASTGENIYLPTAPEAVFASYLVRFQFEDKSIARIVGAFMRTQAYFDYVEGCIGGSAQPNASAQVLAGARLVIPTLSVAKRFLEIISPLDNKVVANNEESQTLRVIRDSLLPKLLSGEIRVREAEREVEQVA